MTETTNPHQSELCPKTGNRLTRWIGRTMLSCIGWDVTGQLPNVPKCLFIGAPHTSNWDFFIAMATIQRVGLRCSWMMKKEAFFWPFGALWKKLGGVPIDRKSKNDITTQMAEWFASVDKGYLGITPEGTRSKVAQFKKGYLRIAYAANVPVFLVGLDAVKKEVVLDKIWQLTGDIDADNRAIKEYYDRTFKGVRPELG